MRMQKLTPEQKAIRRARMQQARLVTLLLANNPSMTNAEARRQAQRACRLPSTKKQRS